MTGRNKRKLEDFDPNKSDSDDGDYGAASSPRARPQARSARKYKAASSARKPAKRQRKETYGDSEDDIEPDSDASSDEDEESFGGSDVDVKVEVNPRTGRQVRGAAKKAVTYEEKSEDEIEAVDTDDSAPSRGAKKKARATIEKPSLLLKLKIPSLQQNMDKPGRPTRSRTGSKSVAKRQPTPSTSSAVGTRKSSRISHSEEPLVELTNSGNHGQVSRRGTATPEPVSRRPTRGGKGVKKHPSAIMEESQEDAQTQPDIFSQLQAEARGRDSEDAEDAVADPPDDERINMEVVEESQEDEEDEAPIARGGRALRQRIERKASTPPAPEPAGNTRRSLRSKKAIGEPSSDFEPEAAEADAAADEEMSDDDLLKVAGPGSSMDESRGGRRSGRRDTRSRQSQRSQPRRGRMSEDEADEELDLDEVADEAADLEEDRQRNRKSRKRTADIAFETNLRTRGKKPDYRVFRPEIIIQEDDDDAAIPPAHTAQRNRRAGGAATAYRSLFSTYGPFGGGGRPPPVFGGPDGQEAAGGADSDSSDDEGLPPGQGVGGMVGMTPTSAFPKGFGGGPGGHKDSLTGAGGGPVDLGKVKDKKALADADPLGVDPNVTFEGVGGLDDHIDRLKEMVALPLLYPEVFQRFHVTPPRGVLFHGPPGTGKTLLARALSSSMSSQGQKVTFYMRKGADALSKWVGEAEKQLRLLFEEARRTQPSIIFFDEIDGLAPVRSSKQEQIHASIVATLLALMDGMDGRGQVIVIGATNRPDNVDAALRRPGRFDREFYFPLPTEKARRSILDIHTKNWEPPLTDEFKDTLAEITKGYAGADLRSLCTEAALNAVQGTYPQIYSSDKKLLIDPSNIKVMAKDFMISVNKIVPSSARSAASGSVPLKKDIEPLLRAPLEKLVAIIDQAIPRKKYATALEEAMFDDRDDEYGFERENMQRMFEASRVFRPRLLVRGVRGMGQRELGGALLAKLEGLHVQNMGLGTLMSDGNRSLESAVIQVFEEVKRHKPSVIYIPDVDIWYQTMPNSVIKTFTGLLQSISPTDPVLLFGYLSQQKPNSKVDPSMLRDLFGYSMQCQFELKPPNNESRTEYFKQIADMVRKSPAQLPEPSENRKPRKLSILPEAPVSTVALAPKQTEKQQKKMDRLLLNWLKLHIQPIMDQIRIKYRKFRFAVVDDSIIKYLYDEQDPQVLSTDLSEEQRAQQALHRPYEIGKDEKGVQGLLEVATGKFYYNINAVVIEQRLSNGYYKRPRDFLADIKRLGKDSKTLGDQERTLKANEMSANVEVDINALETNNPSQMAQLQEVYDREQKRERERVRKATEAAARGEDVPRIMPNVPTVTDSKTTDTSGPVVLGQEVPGPRQLFPTTPGRLAGHSPASNQWSTTNGNSHHTNGSTVPGRMNEDSDMYDNSPQDYAPSQYPDAAGAGFSQANTQGGLSQRTARTQLAHGSQLDQYHNSASTTTSGQKTSDRSNRSSGPYQHSNGHHPDYSTLAPASGGSQLPDTQPPTDHQSSQSQPSQSSQQMPPPAHRHSTINSLLNNPGGAPEPVPAPSLILDEEHVNAAHAELVKRSSGLSVEQLEQVNASLMDALWRTRAEWNRNKVCLQVIDAFNRVVEDILACQAVAKASQEDED